MLDFNRLELDIVAIEHTEDATQKSKANFRSVEQEAARSAAGINGSLNGVGVSLGRNVETAAASATRSIERLEARAALAGKTGVEKLVAQREGAIAGLGGDGTEKAKANFRSVEQEAARSVSGINGALNGIGVSLGRNVETASASAIRSIDRLETRAALAGKTGVEKLVAQREAAIAGLGGDEAAIQRTVAAYDRLIGARQKYEADRVAASAKRASARVGDLLGGLEAEKEAAGGIGDLQKIAARREPTLSKITGLGASQAEVERTVLFFDEITAAIKREEVAVKHAEEVNVSAFRRMMLAASEWAAIVKEKSGEVATRVLETTEGSKILGGGLATPFGGFGKLLGVGIGASIGLNYLDEIAKTNIELDHLVIKTGFGRNALAGLMQIANEQGQGADWERISGALIKFTANLDKVRNKLPEGTEAANEKTLRATQAYRNLGISPEELKLPPEQVFFKAAAGMEALKDHAAGLNASIQVAGKGGTVLVPIMREYGASLEAAANKAGKLSGVTDASADASKKFQQEVAKGRQILQLLGNVLLTILPPAIAAVINAFNFLGAVIIGVFDVFQTGLGVAINGMKDLGILLKDVATGNFKAIPQDAANIKNHFFDTVAAGQKLIEAQHQGLKRDTNILFGPGPAGKREEPEELADESGIHAGKAARDAQQGRESAAELNKQFAELQAHRTETIQDKNADFTKQLRTPDEIRGSLDKAFDAASAAQKEAELKNAAERANGPLRLRNELYKEGTALLEIDAKYFERQRQEMGKGWNDERERRRKAEQDLFQDEQRANRESGQRYFDIESQTNDRERELALQNLGLIDAQSLKDKRALEDAKLAIELDYAQRSAQIQIDKLEHQRGLELGDELKKVGGDENNQAYQDAAAAVNAKYQQDEDAIRQATNDKLQTEAVASANKKTQLQIDENRKVFDSLKHSAEGIFDALLTKSKSFGDALKDLFKTAILTPIKDILSSQTAALFTELLTGQKVTFNPVGNGEGRFGKFGDVLGRAGLGTPRFGQPQQELSNLNQPNHLGDVTLTGRQAVPVEIINAAQVGQAHAQAAHAAQISINSNLTKSVSAPVSITGPSGTTSNPVTESVSSVIRSSSGEYIGGGGGEMSGNAYTDTRGFTDYTGAYGLSDNRGLFDQLGSGQLLGQALSPSSGGGSFVPGSASVISSNIGFGNIVGTGESVGGAFFGSGDNGGFWDQLGSGSLLQIGDVVGGPGGTSGFSGPVEGYGGQGGGGIFGQMLGMGRSAGAQGAGGLGSMLKGMFFKSSDIPMNLSGSSMTTTAGISESLGGGILGHAAGGLAGFAASPMGGAAGMALAMDGWRRGGYKGMMETAAGGALVGFQYGGPVGAAVGAVVGGAIGFVHMFTESDMDHAKKLVKQIYGIKINDATANQIIQIAKQSYGGQISIAVRSQQVRDLLRLYVEAQPSSLGGKPNPFVADKPHAASLVESNGKLYQQAVYDNGTPYSYQSPLSVYGGIQTQPLPTFGPNSGGANIGSLQLVVNGQSASDLLAGQVANVATPGFIQAQSVRGSSSSIGRNQQQALTLAPSAISR